MMAESANQSTTPSLLDAVQSIGELLPFPIFVIDESGTILTASPMVEDEFGYLPEDLVGRPVADLVPEPSRSKHGALMEGYWSNPERRAMGRGLPLALTRRDGSETPVDVTLTPFELDGATRVLCVVRDIADQVAHARQDLEDTQEVLEGIEQALQVRNQMLAEISEMQSWFIGTATPGDDFDALLERVLSFTNSEYGFIGQILRDEDDTPYLHTFAVSNISGNEESRRFYEENAPTGMIFRNLERLFGAVIVSGEIVRANKPASDERSGGLPEGHPALNAFLGVPFLRDGVPVGMVGLANRPGGYSQRYVDSLRPLWESMAQITIAHRTEVARSKAEEQVVKQKDQLEVSNLRMADALRSRNKFMSMVSHELRSPLTPILGYTEGLAYGIYGELSEKQQGVLKNINESGQRLMKLIDDVLAFARADVDPEEAELTPLQLKPFLVDCHRMIASAADMKGLTVELDMEGESPRIMASESHLKTVVMALLDNAVKFTTDGGSLGIRVREAEVDTMVEIEVWDTGIGIDPEDHERIFEPFLQLDNTKMRQFEGSGLGLALAAKVMDTLGGSIAVQSALGEGARFTLRCPAL